MSGQGDAIAAVLVDWSQEPDVWERTRSVFAEVAQKVLDMVASADEVDGHELAGDLGDRRAESWRIVYGATGVERALQEAVVADAAEVRVVPVALALGHLYPRFPRDEVATVVRRVAASHADVDIVLASPDTDAPDLARLVQRLRAGYRAEAGRVRQVIERGFAGDSELFADFMACLQDALPPQARVVLRGSTLTGHSYETGGPFDRLGKGTSDIDLTVVSDELLRRWSAAGFYIPGVLGVPLSDERPDVAPWLEPIRRRLQDMVGRPVTLQPMTRWFLELRTGLLDTPYLVLDE